MISKDKIKQLLDGHLTGSPLFLVELKISGRNQIHVYLDGDNGVPISSCVEVSRLIESNLDREVEDFELEVSSVGLDRPLVLPRQFKKNVGREIIYVNEEGKKVKATLMAADESGITVEKEKAKKKKKDNLPAEDPIQQLAYQDVKDVKVQVSFKATDTQENATF